MTVTAYAAGLPATGDAKVETNDTTIYFPKSLTVKNPDPSISIVPDLGIVFDYFVAGVEPSNENGGTTVSDGTNTITVKEGPDNAILSGKIQIEWHGNEYLNCSPSGAQNIKMGKIRFNLTNFSTAGVYRYQVHESVIYPSDISAIGVTNPGTDRYLDVYVKNNPSGGLQIAGYVMHDGSGNKKSFDDAVYETVNVCIEKEVTGSMGDKDRYFIFQYQVVDPACQIDRFEDIGGKEVIVITYRYSFPRIVGTGNDKDLLDDHYAGYRDPSTGDLKVDPDTEQPYGQENIRLKHGQKYYICGLSKTATIQVTETNTSEKDTYKVSVVGGTPQAATNVAPGGTKTMPETQVSNAANIKFINNLEAVTPTGIIMRYGAAIALVAAGLCFVLLFRSTKKNKA